MLPEILQRIKLFWRALSQIPHEREIRLASKLMWQKLTECYTKATEQTGFWTRGKGNKQHKKIGILLQIVRHACERCRTITHNVWHATRTGECTKLPCLCSQNTLRKDNSARQYVCLPSYLRGRWVNIHDTHSTKLTNLHAIESMSYSDNLTLDGIKVQEKGTTKAPWSS